MIYPRRSLDHPFNVIIFFSSPLCDWNFLELFHACILIPFVLLLCAHPREAFNSSRLILSWTFIYLFIFLSRRGDP